MTAYDPKRTLVTAADLPSSDYTYLTGSTDKPKPVLKPISTELLNRYNMEHAKHGICEHCGQPLELSPSSGLAYCPICRVPIPEARNVWNNPKKWPLNQHLLMAVFWGAVMVLSLAAIMYIGFSKFGIGR